MKLLYVSDTAGTHDRRFMHAYEEAGVEATALALNGHVDPAATVTSAMERISPDVVHAGPIPTAAWAALKAGATPLVSMSWGSDVLVDATASAEIAARVRAVVDASVLVQCDNIAVQQVLVEEFGATEERIVRFPWGVDIQRFSPGPKPEHLKVEFGVTPDSLILLSTRNFEPVYDIPTVLSAFVQAHRIEPRLHLVMLGSGSGEPWARSFIANNGLDHAVSFIGSVQEDVLPAFFRLADLYVACSLSDGSSISLLEAMATGLPVVVSDIAGNRQWVTENQNGWLEPPGDAARFACAMVRAAHLSHAQKHDIATRSRRLVVSEGNWRVNIAHFLERLHGLT